MVAATVSPASGRLRWPARAILRAGYEAVGVAAAVSEEDAQRLARLGVSPDRIRVLGDTRYDSVVERIAGVSKDESLLRFGRGAPTLVAGSTWPERRGRVARGIARVRAKHPAARLALVPHEPTEAHLVGAGESLRRSRAPGASAVEPCTGGRCLCSSRWIASAFWRGSTAREPWPMSAAGSGVPGFTRCWSPPPGAFR